MALSENKHGGRPMTMREIMEAEDQDAAMAEGFGAALAITNEIVNGAAPAGERPTPMTDAQISVHDEATPWVGGTAGYNDLVDFARTLERELDEAKERIVGLQTTLSMKGKSVATHILRAEKAEADLATNAALLARQCDLAREAEAEVAGLKRELVEAWDAAVDWAEYAPEYFREKHGFEDALAKQAKARARSAENGGG